MKTFLYSIVKYLAKEAEEKGSSWTILELKEYLPKSQEPDVLLTATKGESATDILARAARERPDAMAMIFYNESEAIVAALIKAHERSQEFKGLSDGVAQIYNQEKERNTLLAALNLDLTKQRDNALKEAEGLREEIVDLLKELGKKIQETVQ